MNATKPTIVTATSVQQKLENTTKPIGFTSPIADQIKSENVQVTVNGPSQSPMPPSSSTSTNNQVVQRFQTIQLPAQKQQMLKTIQAQIQTILSRKTNSQSEQMVLSKLYQEQAKILASGKIISSSPHPVSCVSIFFHRIRRIFFNNNFYIFSCS